MHLSLSAAALVLLAGVATAHADAGVITDQGNQAAALRPPTAQELSQMRNARAFANRLPVPKASANKAMAEGLNPSLVPGTSAMRLGRSAGAISPRAFGSHGVPYSESRVALGNSGVAATGLTKSYLSTTFPYRAVGFLTFNVGGGGSAYCSASLILRSVLVTAAHCIQDFGSGSQRFNGWRFTPGFYDDFVNLVRPYGIWNFAAFARASTWANGTDTGQDAARNNDLAILILEKNSGQFIGDITGHLHYGWNNYSFVSSPRTGNLAVAETATLGYPVLLDNGGIMQLSNGPTYATTIGGAKQLYQGNPFTAGSSGGPWVTNFRAQGPDFGGGAGAGSQAGANHVVAVTSWGTEDPNVPKDNFASQFGQNKEFPLADYNDFGAGNIGALVNAACTTVRTGGSQTFFQLGYCNN